MADRADNLESFDPSEELGKDAEISGGNVLDDDQFGPRTGSVPATVADAEEKDLNNFFSDLGSIESSAPAPAAAGLTSTSELKSALKKPGVPFTKRVSGFLSKLNFFKKLKRSKTAKPSRRTSITRPAGKKQKKSYGKTFIILIILAAIAYGGWYLYKNSASLIKKFEGNNGLLSDFFGKEKKPISVIPEKWHISKYQISSDGDWVVQVKSCFDKACVNKTDSLLSENNVPINFIAHQSSTINSRLIKLFSTDYIEYLADAKDIVNKINANNTFGLESYIETTSFGYRIVVGSFPAETFNISATINEARSEVNKLFPNLLLDINYQQSQAQFTKITLGPFNDRDAAQKVLDGLQTTKGFAEAVVLKK